MNSGWIGFDLDGTLAKYKGWQGEEHIGEPVIPMVNLLQGFLSQGQEVRIFTARVSSANPNREKARKTIERWCIQQLGVLLPITAEKDFQMIDLYDDRCHQVVPNRGVIVG